jgi:hypothetical protein
MDILRGSQWNRRYHWEWEVNETYSNIEKDRSELREW